MLNGTSSVVALGLILCAVCARFDIFVCLINVEGKKKPGKGQHFTDRRRPSHGHNSPLQIPLFEPIFRPGSREIWRGTGCTG